MRRAVRALRAAYWVWRRELHGMLRAPILYVVGGVFLAVQGIAFAGLVLALSDPQRVALLGELLEGQLAGTLLTWVLSLVVLTLLGMRAIADDKRSGAWELLLTAQVGEGAAVVGKWLAAATIYALLWVPTLAYLGVVAICRADAGGWDAAAIATGYAGAIAIGAALLAWAIAASAAMASTLGAGGLGFAFLILLFLAGELPALWPALADHPAAAALLDALSLRAAALAFARGELTARALALLGGLALTGLSLAITLACAGRRRRRELRLRAAGTAAIVVAALALGALAVRHPLRLDVSAARRNTLDPATREVLADVADASLTIVRPTLGAVDPIYEEVARIARRMAEVAPGLAMRVVDPAAAPGGLPAIARAAGLEQARVEASGAVVVELGARRRVIDLAQIVTPARDARGQLVIAQLAIEQALAGALAALASSSPVTVCATTGHGELRLLETDPAGLDWTFVADRLRGEGMTLEELTLAGAGPGAGPGAGEVPRACRVVVVAGPARPLGPAEALALQRFVHEGGGLLVAAPSRQLGEVLGKTGLEAVLAADGLGLPAAIAIDPASALRDQPGLLAITSGYADHPINAGFSGVRPTLWFQPRVVAVEGGARPLVSASPGSWGETDLFAAPEKQDQDLAGPVALAALGGKHAVIAVGSAESFSTVNLANRLSATDLWLARAIRFLGGAEPRVAVAARAPDQVRLLLTGGQQAAIIALSVGGIPLAWLLLGGGLVWWRRRRAERAAGGAP
jgi:ABC-2 type transport system permease protein